MAKWLERWTCNLDVQVQVLDQLLVNTANYVGCLLPVRVHETVALELFVALNCSITLAFGHLILCLNCH